MIESLDTFLADFGVTAQFGTQTGRMILNAADVDVTSGRILSREYQARFKTSDFPSLAYGSALTVDGVAYTVLEVMAQSDGKFSVAHLQAT